MTVTRKAGVRRTFVSIAAPYAEPEVVTGMSRPPRRRRRGSSPAADRSGSARQVAGLGVHLGQEATDFLGQLGPVWPPVDACADGEPVRRRMIHPVEVVSTG